MMHSRGFVLSENQAFAGQTRTPGPSRLHASPTRKNMTTGKRALGGSSNPFGQDMGSAGPKQLFQDLMSSKSPMKALGDRNASKTPGPSKSGPSKQDASLRKGKASSSSPTKNGSSEFSPRKASTSNALRSINGKQRQTTELPFTKPGQDSTNDAAGNMMKTPAPSQLGKARTLSRHNSFITPAANIGRAGQIKARMGEILDAEMGLSLQKADNATEQATEQPAVQMTEEEMYPEIEYMPPSVHAKHPVFEFPDELDDLPRAKQLGAQLSTFSTIGLRAAGPGDLSDVEILPLEADDEDDMLAPAFAVESDDDDPWPDVPVTDGLAGMQQLATCRPVPTTRGTASTLTRPSTACRTTASANVRAPSTGVRPPVATATKRPAASSSAKPAVASSSTNARAGTGKLLSQPSARSSGLQRSIASAPGDRAKPSSASAATRTPSAARRATTVAPPSVRSTASTTKAVVSRAAVQTPRSTSQLANPAQQPTTRSAKTLNPKLIDFVDDDLGKQTAATLERLEAEEGFESLQLDLSEPCDNEA